MAPLSEAKIIDAVKKSRGLIAVTARSLGIDRKTIYNRAHTSEAIREAIAEARDFTTDTAEAALFKAIQAGEPWAVCFYLKTQGKDRGYVERQEITGKNNEPIEVQVMTDEQVHQRANVLKNRLLATVASPSNGNGKHNGNGNGNGNH